MKNNDPTQQSAKEAIETTYTLLQATRGLRGDKAGSEYTSNTDRPVMFGELVHYMHGSAEVDEIRIQDQLRRNLSLRRQFNHLLECTRIAVASAQAQAASNEPLSQRETRTFTLKFKCSRANLDQVYVLLTVHPESGMADGKTPVILAKNATDIERLCFPPLKDHSTQLMFVANDERLVLVQDGDTELSLM